jgi:hypothetical protein
MPTVAISGLPERITDVSGPRDPRHPRPEETTVEVPLPSRAHPSRARVEEPWWKTANQRVAPPPRPRTPPPTARPAPQPTPRATRAPARNRHAKAPGRTGTQLALLVGVGVVAIAAAVGVLTVVLSGFDVLNGNVLDVSKAEAGVQRILLDPEDGYGATNVSDVRCNNGDDPQIKKGGSFTCAVLVDGRKRHVLVVFSDDDGTYAVDRPR